MRSADYVEETTTSIASSGAGAVTLTALTNIPRFSTVFGTQNTTVRYSIEDTVNKKYEEGIGSVSSNVLTRTLPQVTWDGTTWSALNPSALTFTGSPSSGNIRIRMAPTASGMQAAMPGRQSVIAGDSNWRDYPLSNEKSFQNTSGSLAVTADREYYAPYFLSSGGVLSGIQFEVGTGVSSTNIKMALYACGGDGLPGAKILDFVTTSTATSGIKTDTASASWSPAGKVHLAPGWYYIGFILNGAPNLIWYAGNNPAPLNPIGRASVYGYSGFVYVAGSYTAGLPASPSLSGGTMGDPGVKDFPRFGLKVVS